jgi:hypothetical protein
MLPRPMSALGAEGPRGRSLAAPAWPIALWLVQVGAAAILMTPSVLALLGRRIAATGTWAVGTVGLLWALGALALVARATGRGWIRARRLQLLALFVSSLLSFPLLGELAVRLVEKRDIDGNVRVRAQLLHPYRLPKRDVEEKLARYFSEGSSRASLVADPELGWAPRPGSNRPPYAYERSGIRATDAQADYAEKPAGPALRVAVFGDSFTNGIGAEFGDTWATQVERQAPAGRLEVLNFGVAAYGIDQALLRYRKLGRRFAPDVVVLGLQLENMSRNVNVMRPFYHKVTELPFTKPRFVIRNGGLDLLNVPTLPPERVAETIGAFDAWPLRPYEHYYDPEDYRKKLWHSSHLLTLIVEAAAGVMENLEQKEISPTVLELGLKIIDTFSKEATAAGSRFIAFHLATRYELEALVAGKPSPHARELEAVGARMPVVESTEALLRAAKEGGIPALYNDSQHFAPPGNRAVASALLPELLAMPAPRREATAP